jgi:hypothetical protein
MLKSFARTDYSKAIELNLKEQRSDSILDDTRKERVANVVEIGEFTVTLLYKYLTVRQACSCVATVRESTSYDHE